MADNEKHERPQISDVKVGAKIGRLLLLKETRVPHGKKYTDVGYICKCDCGKEKIVRKSDLTSGKVLSCGCYASDVFRKTHTKHGMAYSRVYRIWFGIKKRCFYKNEDNYYLYGGRGITMCDKWKNSFEAFYADVGEPPGNEYSIDRINPNGNYEPGNCRWATQKQQAQNTRRNYLVFYNGKERSIAEVSDIVGISRGTLYQRIKGYGWSVERATTTPIQTKFRSKNYAKH